MLTRRKLLMGAALAPAFSMIAKPVLSEITLGVSPRHNLIRWQSNFAKIDVF